jgi:hypothetical protein
MQKRTKLIISVMVAIASFIAMMAILNSPTMFQSNLLSYVFFALALICLVSIVAIITFSRNGWLVIGSLDEWTISDLIRGLK